MQPKTRVALGLAALSAATTATAENPLRTSSPAAPSAIAHATYPARPVRFVVPFPPGASDVVARIAGQKLSEHLGQQFVIDNRSGAGSTMGAAIAAKALPDGYTIFFTTASFAIGAAYYNNLPYDAINDFTAVGMLADGPLLFVIHPAVTANTIAEFIALAKARPGQLNYASAGAGTVSHLAGELFNRMAAVRITHIPYRGAGPALIDLMANQVQLLIAPLGILLPHVKAGRLKALALPGARRSALAPDLPTVAESGLPGYAAATWYGVLAPHGTPRNVIEVLNKTISNTLGTLEMRTQLAALGIEPVASTSAQFGEYMRSEIEKYKRIVKDAGLEKP